MNQETTDKKTGKVYGSRYYCCGYCGLQVQASLTDRIIPHIWNEISNIGVDELYKEHLEQIQKMKHVLSHDITELKRELKEHLFSKEQHKEIFKQMSGKNTDDKLMLTLQIASSNIDRHLPDLEKRIKELNGLRQAVRFFYQNGQEFAVINVSAGWSCLGKPLYFNSANG